jgi:hypothetical protein
MLWRHGRVVAVKDYFHAAADLLNKIRIQVKLLTTVALLCCNVLETLTMALSVKKCSLLRGKFSRDKLTVGPHLPPEQLEYRHTRDFCLIVHFNIIPWLFRSGFATKTYHAFFISLWALRKFFGWWRKNFRITHGVQNVFVRLMITVQKTHKNILNSFSHLP